MKNINDLLNELYAHPDFGTCAGILFTKDDLHEEFYDGILNEDYDFTDEEIDEIFENFWIKFKNTRDKSEYFMMGEKYEYLSLDYDEWVEDWKKNLAVSE
jgi:hypothetical protein